MEEIQNKIQMQEETQLEMTKVSSSFTENVESTCTYEANHFIVDVKAYIERDRLKDDLMVSQRRWEEMLNNMDEVITNKCQAEQQLTANKLLSIQEMVVYNVFLTNTFQ